MSYRLEVRNRTNFGCKTFKRETLSEVKQLLNNYLFEGEVKLYETKEISLPCNYEHVRDYKLTEIGNQILWDNSCVSKSHGQKRE